MPQRRRRQAGGSAAGTRSAADVPAGRRRVEPAVAVAVASAALRAPLRRRQGAKDLKTVLFNWTWRMGMLRSGAESELVKTLDYHAAGGTMQVNGQPCTLTKYRVQANYQVPGWRTQIECTFKNKQTYKNVETLSGDYAWDEDMPGAELVARQGQGDTAARHARGAADPSVGESSRRGEGRHRRRGRHAGV